MNKKLNRSVKEKVIGGVAGGLAEYFEIDPVIVRVLLVVSLFFGGVGFIAYIIMWIIIPEAPYVFEGAANFNATNSSASAPETNTQANDPASAYFKSLDEKKLKRNRNIGIVLMVIGFIFLADNFIPRIHFGDFWPVILIALGVSLLLNSKKV